MLNNKLNSKYFILCFMLLFAKILVAAEFSAVVNKQNFNPGESVELNLSLVDAKALDAPDLSELSVAFTIYSKQQYSSYSNTNGNVTSTAGWVITMFPNNDGNIIIPSIEVNTNKGRLRSQEFSINVAKTAPLPSTAPTSSNNLGIYMIASTSKVKAYVKEPFVYTLKIVSHKALANVTLEDIKSKDAIIDRLQKPKQYSQVIDGSRAEVIEFKYYITPLVAGKIEISPAVIHGDMQEPLQVQPGNRFNRLQHMFFDAYFDLKPFTVKGDRITINVVAPVTKAANWLPLQNLVLSEDWSNLSKIRVGDTITRKIKMVATGAFANQLPSVKDYIEIEKFKVYVDKPNLSDNTEQQYDYVIGTKEESFSLVPLEEGTITLPEIKIHWWNLRTNKPEISSLPARTIEVMAANLNQLKDSTQDYSIAEQKTETTSTLASLPKWLYALLVALVLVILSMTVIIVYLLKRKKSADAKQQPKTEQYSQKEIVSSSDLKDQIIMHAVKYWQAPPNITLAKLGEFLNANAYSYDLSAYNNLSKDLNSAIYAGARLELQTMVNAWEQFKASVSKKKAARAMRKRADLNPT